MPKDPGEQSPRGGLEPAAAGRVLSDAQWQPDPELVAAGWERRFIADAQRVQEALELYAQLGYDVRAEPVRVEELREECEDCRVVIALQFKTIYTRKKVQ